MFFLKLKAILDGDCLLMMEPCRKGEQILIILWEKYKRHNGWKIHKDVWVKDRTIESLLIFGCVVWHKVNMEWNKINTKCEKCDEMFNRVRMWSKQICNETYLWSRQIFKHGARANPLGPLRLAWSTHAPPAGFHAGCGGSLGQAPPHLLLWGQPKHQVDWGTGVRVQT